MTVSSQIPFVSYSYTGPGTYSFSFRVFEGEDLLVQHTDDDGTISILTPGSDYEVATTEGVDGGEVAVTSPAASGGILDIQRDIDIVQEVDFVANSPLPAQTLEDAFDRLTMICQQLDTLLESSLVTTDWKGDWLTAESYEIRDVVTAPNTNIYICINDHTSGTFVDDLADGYWKLVVDVSAATDAAAAALVSEANASTSEDNAANCAAAAYTSASNAATSAANAYGSELAADAARDQVVDTLATNTRSHYTLGTSGSVTLDPDNGALQICNMTSNVTLVDDFVDTQMIEVMVKTNGNVLTLPVGAEWVNQTYQISSSLWNCYRFWKVSGTLYGAVLNS